MTEPGISGLQCALNGHMAAQYTLGTGTIPQGPFTCPCGAQTYKVPPQPEPGRQSNEQLPHDEISALAEEGEALRDEHAYIDKALDAAGVSNLDEDSVAIACDLRVDALIAQRDRYRDALALLRGYVGDMGSSGWHLINAALSPHPMVPLVPVNEESIQKGARALAAKREPEYRALEADDYADAETVLRAAAEPDDPRADGKEQGNA